MRDSEYEVYVLVKKFSPNSEGYEALTPVSISVWDAEDNQLYGLLTGMVWQIYQSKTEIEEEVYERLGTRNVQIDIDEVEE